MHCLVFRHFKCYFINAVINKIYIFKNKGDDKVNNILGERIKKYRIDNDITQVDFAKKLDIGRSTLSNIETGENRGTIEFLFKLSRITRKPISFWIDEDTIEEAEIKQMSTITLLADALHDAGAIGDNGKIPDLFKDRFIALLEKEFEIRFLEQKEKALAKEQAKT